MVIRFEDYLAKTNQATTVDELLNCFLEAVKQHGYDKIIFCLLSEHKHIGLEAGVGHLRNYPSDWMKYYFENNFDKVDPVISYAYQKQSAFTWKEMEQRLDLTRKQKLCLNLGVEAGLHNGICAPLWGPHRFAGVGLASSNQKDACDGNIDLISAYCKHFYIVFQRLYAVNTSTEYLAPNIYLTDREREILTCVAEGKSDHDISRIVRLTPYGVNFHIRNIFKKLGTNSRIYAAAKAITLGLINPSLNPYIRA